MKVKQMETAFYGVYQEPWHCTSRDSDFFFNLVSKQKWALMSPRCIIRWKKQGGNLSYYVLPSLLKDED